jgi:quinol monooxygenase YgiN
MSEPLFFISHFRIKVGAFEALQRLTRETTEVMRSQKPHTLLFLSYVDEERGVVSFLHAFADAAAMDLHFEGADERSRAAFEHIEPIGWEFYGRPSEAAIATMRQAADASGATLALHPGFLGGFLRLAPA